MFQKIKNHNHKPIRLKNKKQEILKESEEDFSAGVCLDWTYAGGG